MRSRMVGLLAGLLLAGAASALFAADTAPGEAYDLIFRTGTLDGVSRNEGLVYRRSVQNDALPGEAAAETGELRLVFPPGAPDTADLRLIEGERFRAIGSFPAGVGNPVAMYFVESVVRDMARTMGGSPFYIRNRLKEALMRPAERRPVRASWGAGEVAAEVVVLHPFEADPARARMGAFADMEIAVTVSDAVPGWYRSLSATVPGAGGAAYAARLTLTEPAAEPGQ
ncbi:hypothetical protein [Rhodovulum visakhapatnamense]|uniref:Uncharacterized protein n=1 Tax=Rhodovulum visakhapatnamense TaxID=364297 RepID=A0A4V3GU75_9RHOB|nr:hypothetical protein [Rhodovulum visakhapatnamense]TDX29758.1 hypothetical protein EV657_108180 [Rhodovulum visakhapatnamense]